ncbi:hypothetical protein NP233_g9883 [Leucocoprinus birnbaumii]|uniref:Uncharacterized protein n=1 Tax=Leucocoprinus birnbaumii TaxID=56174 RepID=A0AAD5VJU8_9AGAR|nr:hypothetical protein NP233_g9883 [Leucocoprinus birnbaumii]
MSDSGMRKFGKRGTTMAVVCVAAIGGALAAMYRMDKDVKQKEGNTSPYQEHSRALQGGSDKKMTSSDVAAAVSVPKPGRERLQSTHGEPSEGKRD